MYRLAVLALLFLTSCTFAAPPKAGHHGKVLVTGPTRLDWTFVVSTQSLTKVPEDWLSDYDSAKQSYELFVPTRKDPKAPAPLLIYVAPGDEPNAYKAFEKLAKAHDMYLVAPRGAGNGTAGKKRVRIVLDVLDEVRRNYAIDPDRTYIAGFSGGGRIASAIAFALPETFGGVMPICAGEYLREEPWLRQRVIDRLSVALLTGEKDFNRGEVERLRAPYFTDVGVRTKVWTVSGMGHDIPSEKTQAEAMKWLEGGLKKRQELAKEWPASRLSAETRKAQAEALLAEGQKRLAKKATLYTGLMQVKGVSERWPDLAAGKDAQKLLVEYDGKKEKPWEAEDIAEQRRFLIASAKALDGYATGPLDPQYQKQKPKMIEKAINMYQQLIADSPDSDAAKEAQKRIEVLRAALKK